MMIKVILQCMRAFVVGFVTVFTARSVWYAVRDRIDRR
jgi:hypothetical protein